MSEYIANDYVKFIEAGRRDKLSPFGLGLIAKEYRRLEAEKAELMEFINNQADEYEDSLATKFLMEHREYIIQGKPEETNPM